MVKETGLISSLFYVALMPTVTAIMHALWTYYTIGSNVSWLQCFNYHTVTALTPEALPVLCLYSYNYCRLYIAETEAEWLSLHFSNLYGRDMHSVVISILIGLITEVLLMLFFIFKWVEHKMKQNGHLMFQ